ncbi:MULTISPECIES: DUF2934 domain-containing protein [unclassified Chelatococcus]|uniref:DUF2934 domain-containing protein n=1 Tax=unclassified Chelatococcus TaxID=2638111 RepID=UPI001BD135F9|nr:MULTISPECIES: DUF2934 domain-containing protein [unclassified Chelatococcus]CAH1654057.1 hypothetical protein CHELA20_11051 [Hyphomicrobiales bacterium]MBS7742831.1 DUF2934 domain-containing protein [Chelatococcus sp. HY11]MBX3542051.1 DUF2934 domain-containing protein [Chelatococcus sp.]MCO5074057.1 DUF2934 domain-containing protein [Chelatococcus sp.]CAH1694748.1 hypothetical protein CHELA41_51282 [Hyphomicrobiales bacterium]
MDERENRIRQRAHQLWEEEGRPEGRAERHWFQAKEIVAVEEGYFETLEPVDTVEPGAAEPIEALSNAGEFPTLTDQGEMQIPNRPEPSSDTPAGAKAGRPAPVRKKRDTKLTKNASSAMQKKAKARPVRKDDE